MKYRILYTEISAIGRLLFMICASFTFFRTTSSIDDTETSIMKHFGKAFVRLCRQSQKKSNAFESLRKFEKDTALSNRLSILGF